MPNRHDDARPLLVITRQISNLEESRAASSETLVAAEFLIAYRLLRQAAGPKGDLRIRLSIVE